MKRAILLLMVITGMILARALAHAGTPSRSPSVCKITLHSCAAVATSRPVTVGDIATVEGPGSIAGKASAVVITSAPLPGTQRTIEAEYVKLKLSAAGFGAAKVCGAAKIAMTGKCTRISPQTLEDLVKDYAGEMLPKDGLTYDIAVERSPRELVLPDDPAIEVKPRLFSSAIHTGVNTVAIEASLAGRSICTTTAVVRIKATAVVLIAAATIDQGQALTDQNTKTEARDITKIKDPISAGAGNPQGWVARRIIQPGSVITAADVALPPDVRLGDQVTLTVKCGSVAIRTSAEARQDGRVGDTIRVRSSVSSDELRARVTSAGSVEIAR